MHSLSSETDKHPDTFRRFRLCSIFKHENIDHPLRLRPRRLYFRSIEFHDHRLFYSFGT